MDASSFLPSPIKEIKADRWLSSADFLKLTGNLLDLLHITFPQTFVYVAKVTSVQKWFLLHLGLAKGPAFGKSAVPWKEGYLIQLLKKAGFSNDV